MQSALSGLHGEFFRSVFAGSSTVLLNKTQRSTKIFNITLSTVDSRIFTQLYKKCTEYT